MSFVKEIIKFNWFLNFFINWLTGPLICLLIVEIFFGFWFEKDNFGPYMREHRLKKNPVVLTYKDIKYDTKYYDFQLKYNNQQKHHNTIKSYTWRNFNIW